MNMNDQDSQSPGQNRNELTDRFMALLLAANPSQLTKIEEQLRKEQEEQKAEKEKRERLFELAEKLRNVDRKQIKAATHIAEAFSIQSRLEAHLEKQVLVLLRSLAQSVEDGTTIWDVCDGLAQGDPILKEVIMEHALARMAVL